MKYTANIDDQTLYISLPSHINECNFVQLLFLKQNAGNINPDLLAFVWLQTCVSEATFETLLDHIDHVQLHDLAVASLQSMTFDEAKLAPALRTKPPLALLYLKNITLYPSGNLLQTMCFGQFVDAEEQLFLYFANNSTDQSTNNPIPNNQATKHLAALAATIYRPYNESRYSSTRTFELAPLIQAELDQDHLEIILDHYLACRYYITNKFKKTFPQQKTDNKKQTTDNREQKTGPSTQNIREMVNGYNNKMIQYATTPTRKQEVYHENAWTVLEFIEHDIAKAQAEQKALEKLNH